MERVDQRVRGEPSQGAAAASPRVRSAGAAEEKEFSAGTQERLERLERPGLDPHGADRDEVERLVELGARQQLLESRGLDLGVPEPSARTASRRNTALRVLTSTIRSARCGGKLERDRRRTAARSGVEQRPRIFGDVSRRDHRFDQQPIDRVVFSFRRQPERREVDLRVPFVRSW